MPIFKLSLYSKTKLKIMLNYEEFYERLWNYFLTESDVSYDYRENNQEFIRMITFSMFQDYQKHNVSEMVYGKMLKIFFSNLFLFTPSVFDDGNIRDFNKY